MKFEGDGSTSRARTHEVSLFKLCGKFCFGEGELDLEGSHTTLVANVTSFLLSIGILDSEILSGRSELRFCLRVDESSGLMTFSRPTGAILVLLCRKFRFIFKTGDSDVLDPV